MLSSRLMRLLSSRREPLGVAIIGAGAMGKGILYQMLITRGVRCLGLCDKNINTAVSCAEELEIPYTVVETAAGVEDAIRAGRLPVCADGMLLAQSCSVETLVEGSSAIMEGARFVIGAIETGKHVVLM